MAVSSTEDLIEARRWISDCMRGRVCVPWSPVRVSVDRLDEYLRRVGAPVIARIGEVVGVVLDVRSGEGGFVVVEMAIPAAGVGGEDRCLSWFDGARQCSDVEVICRWAG
ncbi:hypothetical protein [Corynebacterium provencense]|uniref:hypothetical protein n=1 Tax=Corynebacterium provencense TaxID=1737425 RepID=UPI0011C965F5|nr:hypothetical protein [Corynebacterium provencense]